GKAKMTDGERFDQGAGPKMKFRHHVVVVLAFGPQFLDPADDAAIAGAHLAAEEHRGAALSFSRPQDVLRGSSRSHAARASPPTHAPESVSTRCRCVRR